MASPLAAAEGEDQRRHTADAPDWLACDLLACRVVQDVSTQIVATCRSFGAQLQGVCGQAVEQLPAAVKSGADGDATAVDCADACLSFLTAFGLLSNALLCVAGDLECAVTKPLQKTIATLQEESTGRLKHWQQVRTRFSELQERYGRSRQRSLEARGKLASAATSEGSRSWGWNRSTKDGRAATEQHAAMCDLARCEEELLRSEASLRELEDESRERLRQLEREKRALLRGVLTKGACSLRRLLPLADKVPPPEECGEVAAPEEWQSVLPPSGVGVFGTSSRMSAKEEAPCNAAPVLAKDSPSPEAGDMAAKEVTRELQNEKDCQRKDDTLRKDPSAKYLQGGGMGAIGLEFAELGEAGGLSEESEPEDAAARAAAWSPQPKASSEKPAFRKQRSLVFQSSGGAHLVAKSSLVGLGESGGGSAACAAASGGTPGAMAPRREQRFPTGCAPSPSAGTPASEASTARSSQTVAGATPFTLNRLATFHLEETGTSASAGALHRVAQVVTKGCEAADEDGRSSSSSTAMPAEHVKTGDNDGASSVSSARPHPADAVVAAATLEVSWKEVRITQAGQAPALGVNKPRSGRVEEDSEDDDDDELGTGKKRHQFVPLEAPEVALELSPLVAGDPRQCFERYVQRLHENIASSTECAWDKLQARAGEHLLGGLVGKLEFFWIHRPGREASPEATQGLVCFQFVQGAAANFARVLHLSVADSTESTWQELLPSAVFEVRRLVFGTLPVDSIRAVVLAGEDDSGRIYVDGDMEAAFERCRFRWFQLTQNLRRTRSSTLRLQKRGKKLASRFLVLHSHRAQTDPKAPHSNIGRLPSLLLKDEIPRSGSLTDTPSSQDAGGGFTPF